MNKWVISSTEELSSLTSSSVDLILFSSPDVDLNVLSNQALTNKKKGIIFNVFKNSRYLELFSDAKPLEGSNKDTLDFLCPTHIDLKEKVKLDLKELVDADVDIIILNYLHYPTEWDLEKPNLLDTCYCKRCLNLFEQYIQEKVEGSTLEETVLNIDGLYYQEWLDFKTDKISSFVKELSDIILNSGNQVELGIMVPSWEHMDYGSGIKRLLGLDYETIKQYIHMFLPNFVNYDGEVTTEYFANKLNYLWVFGKPVFPVINASVLNSNNLSQETKKITLEVNAKNDASVIFDLRNCDDVSKAISLIDKY